MRQSSILLFVLGSALWSQVVPSKDVLIDAKNPSVYILRVGTPAGAHKDDGVWLEFRNNTKWAISIRTESLYIGDKVKPVTLQSGKGVLAMRPGTVVSPCYSVESTPAGSRETVNEEPYQRLKLGNACTVGSTSWLPSGGDVRLQIPSDHLGAGRRISIDFQYEWEASTSVEHRVLFSVNEPSSRRQK